MKSDNKNRSDYLNDLAKKKGFKNRGEYKKYLAQRRGFKNCGEYEDYLAQVKGFKNNTDYQVEHNHITGKSGSMYFNKHCPLYLGVYIAEGVLSKIFDEVQRMSNNTIGYDFICKFGYKIDVKSACLCKNSWFFTIRRNKIADYFLLVAFDNRNDLNPKHLWLIKCSEIIVNDSRGVALNEKVGLVISDSIYSLSKYKKYEQTDKLKKLIRGCDNIK